MQFIQVSTSDSLYREALQLRYKLLYKPFGLTEQSVGDEFERQSLHFVVIKNENLIAYGRLTLIDSEQVQFSQLVVEQTHQKSGNGTYLIKGLIKVAIHLKVTSIQLNARKVSQAFYQKFGFKRIGDLFLSPISSIEHIPMELRLLR